MSRIACLVLALVLVVATALAAPPGDRLRPISEADAVLAVYQEGWGLVSDGSPRIILAAWPDGLIVWSEDRVAGGAPYRAARIDPRKFSDLLTRFEKDGLLSDKTLNQSHFGPDSQFITVLAKSGKKMLKMQSWHELYEESGAIVDDLGVHGAKDRRRIDSLRKLPPDYMFFRLLWSETRGRMAGLIPAEGRITTGQPRMEKGVLSWQEELQSTKKD